MNNDILQILFNLALIFAVPGVTWFLVKKVTSQMTMDIKEIQIKQSLLRERLPIEYTRKSDYVDDIREIKQLLRDLMVEIRNKADKE